MAIKLLLSLCLFATLAAIVPAPPVDRGQDLRNFLIQYGYLDGKSTSQEEFRDAVREFQKTYGLDETGEYSESMDKLIYGQRCGNKDVNNENSEIANFVVKTSWPSRYLTYKYDTNIRNSVDLRKNNVGPIVNDAFQMWANAVTSGLYISEAGRKDANDIEFRFYSGDHGDGYAFDGPGGVLGHAFYPQNGRIHLDADELWSGNYVDGISLEYVAVHEIGHSLGLRHTNITGAVMFPYYPEVNGPVSLAQDDIDGINYLYP